MDLGRAPRLVHEPAVVDLVVEEVALHHLERDRRSVRVVFRAKDPRHPALAEQTLEPVGPQSLANLGLASRRPKLRHRGVA